MLIIAYFKYKCYNIKMAFVDKNEELIELLKNVKKDFREKKLKPFYFLYGNEEYFIDQVYDGIVKVFTDDTGLNFKLYDKNSFQIEEIIKYIETLPLMNDKKLIVFKDISFFRSGKKDEKNVNDFINALDKSKDQNIVVVIDHSSDNDKYIKYFGKNNLIATYFEKNGILIDLHRLDGATLNKNVVNKFSKAGINIDKVEAAYIIRNVGRNLKNLYNECDKIISYIGDKKSIERTDIDTVLTKNVEDNIFNLISLVNSNQYEKATELYGELRGANEKTGNMFAVLSNNYQNLLIVKDYLEKSKGQNEIAKLMGMELWRVKDLVLASKYVTKETLVKKLDRITELNLKRFRDELSEELVFELLYLK